jgi:hypothetical protein
MNHLTMMRIQRFYVISTCTTPALPVYITVGDDDSKPSGFKPIKRTPVRILGRIHSTSVEFIHWHIHENTPNTIYYVAHSGRALS